MVHRALEHRARALVALLLVVLAGVALSACGGDDGGSSGDSADARTLLDETFSGTREIRSGHVALTVKASERGQPIALQLSGPFETQGDDYPKFDIDVDLRLGAQGNVSAGLVSTGDRLFFELESSAYEVPADMLNSGSEQSSRRFEIPDFDPQSWIDDPQVVGQEDVGGVETEHISGTVDVGALLDSVDDALRAFDRQGLGAVSGDQLPTEITAEQRAEIERAIRSAKVDVWTGSDDKTLRRLAVEVDATRDGRPFDVAFELELTELNESQSISAPRDVKPLTDLLSGLSGLLGGSGLGSSGGASDDSLGDYQRCITEAGADVAEAQKCADLLTR